MNNKTHSDLSCLYGGDKNSKMTSFTADSIPLIRPRIVSGKPKLFTVALGLAVALFGGFATPEANAQPPVIFTNPCHFRVFNHISFDPEDERSLPQGSRFLERTDIVRKFDGVRRFEFSSSGGDRPMITNYGSKTRTRDAGEDGGPVSGEYFVRLSNGSRVSIYFDEDEGVDAVGAFVGGDELVGGVATMTVYFTEGPFFRFGRVDAGLEDVPDHDDGCHAINGFMGVDSGPGRQIVRVDFHQDRDPGSLDSIFFGEAEGITADPGPTGFPMNPLRLSGACADTWSGERVLPGEIRVTTPFDELDAGRDPGSAGTGLSLREAIHLANEGIFVGGCPVPGSDTTIVPTIIVPSGTYTLSRAGSGEDENATGDLDIKTNMVISGAGACGPRATIIRAGTDDRVFHIRAFESTVDISGVTIRDGRTDTVGGGIYNTGYEGASILDNNVTIRDCIISDNSVTSVNAGGGGIFNYSSHMTLINTRVTNNRSESAGGGIYTASGRLDLIDCTVSFNQAHGGSPVNVTHVLVEVACLSSRAGWYQSSWW